MNIRPANKFDCPYFIHLIHKIHELKETGSWNIELEDSYISSVFNTILHGGGIALVAEKNNEPIGMAVGLINPNLWSPKLFVIHQIVFFVDEEYRHTKAAHSLLTNYLDEVEKLKEQKRIQYSTITASKTMFDIDFSRFGYEFVEKTWTCDGVN